MLKILITEQIYNKILSEQSVSNEEYVYYNIDNENGRARIQVGNNALKKILILYGYRNIEEVDSLIEKQQIIRDAKRLKPEITLLDWSAKEKGLGFGRSVIQKIFELGEKYKINKFTIFRPSYDARKILSHYTNKGNLKPIENSVRGGSFDTHYTEYFLIKKP